MQLAGEFSLISPHSPMVDLPTTPHTVPGGPTEEGIFWTAVGGREKPCSTDENTFHLWKPFGGSNLLRTQGKVMKINGKYG